MIYYYTDYTIKTSAHKNRLFPNISVTMTFSISENMLPTIKYYILLGICLFTGPQIYHKKKKILFEMF